MRQVISKFFGGSAKSERRNLARGHYIYSKNDRVDLALFAIAMYQGNEKFCPEGPGTLVSKSKSGSVRELESLHEWLKSVYRSDSVIETERDTIEAAALKVLELLVQDIVSRDPLHENIDKLFDVLYPIEKIQILSNAFENAEKTIEAVHTTLQEYLLLNPVRGLAIKPNTARENVE